MAKGVINLQKESGGIVKISPVDGVGVTELVVPESGNLVSVNTAVTDNAIARYDGTTGKLQNSGVYIDDNGNVGVGVTLSAWSSGEKAIELPHYGYFVTKGPTCRVASNVYDNYTHKYTIYGPASMYEQAGGSHIWYSAPLGTAGSPITWTNAMTLSANGSLVVGGTGENFIQINSNDADTNIYLQARTTSGFQSVYQHTIDGVTKSAILANGNFLSATNSYGSTSDIKLKENISDATPKLEKLMQVQVRNFNYIGQEDKQIGVVAQEIEQIFPSIVHETKDTKQVEVTKTREVIDKEGNTTTEEYTEFETQETGEVTKNVKYSVIYMMMLKAMQEQQEIINDLKVRVEKLELGAK